MFLMTPEFFWGSGTPSKHNLSANSVQVARRNRLLGSHFFGFQGKLFSGTTLFWPLLIHSSDESSQIT
jgi:hypothetical protein